MAARIVYEGAAGKGGDLFQGMKIWLSLRVPSRDRWKEQVESNGGVIAKLEKGADVIIVDHARKDCPPGSISWKWIEQSVKKGVLEDIEDHRAGPVHGQVREVGATQPTKKTRTKFTPADDQLLEQMVARAERKGLPILGNVIYKEFAARYPHHTWQSWMDRWKKYLSSSSRPSLPEDDDEEEEAEEEVPEPEPRPVPAKRRQPRFGSTVSSAPSISGHRPSKPRQISQPKLPKKPRAVSPVVSERSHNSARSLQRNPFVLKSTGGDVFTADETKLLFDAFNDIMDLSDDQIIDAWIAWSSEYPNHTPQEWRNHFKEYVVPTKLSRLEPKKAAKRAKDMLPPEQAKKREPAPNTRIVVPARPRGNEIKDSQESSGQTVLSPAKQPEPVEPYEADEADEAIETVPSHISSAEEFEVNLLALADALELEIEPNPVICDRTVPLFDLWQVVRQDEFRGYDNVTGRKLWRRVAKKLGFVENTNNAGRDLQACFSEILCDLEEIEQRQQEGEDMTSSQEQELILDQLQQTEGHTEDFAESEDEGKIVLSEDQEEDESLRHQKEQRELLREQEENDNDLNVIPISSPPLASSITSKGKRRSGNYFMSPDLPRNKRQRINKGKGKERLEIPSTPEDVINNTQMSRPTQQLSPLKHLQAESSSSVASSPIQEIRPMKLERKKAVARQHIEPEKQRLFYAASEYPQRPNDDDDDEDDEVDSLGSILGPPDKEIDDPSDKEENGLFIGQELPSPPDHSCLRNVSNTTTRGTLHSSNNNDSSTQSQNDSQSDLATWINKQVSDGFTQDIVVEAVQAASGCTDEALIAMNALADGTGLPENVAGVWTAEDDEALDKRKGTEEFKHILFKHGISRILKRRQYKALLRTVAEQEGVSDI
ncbi:hypothetical protein WAI453_010195 [Rhynchosporium graminicola]